VTGAIVHVASGREWRGGQRQVWLLARELRRLGLQRQTIITTEGSELARRLADDGLSVRAVRWRAGLDLRALWAVRQELRASRAPALVHAHDAHALTLAGLARLGRSVPLIVTRRVTFPIRRAGFWTRADRIIAISAAVGDALAARGVSPERVHVIPSGVDLASPRHEPAAVLRGCLGVTDGTALALNIAALTPEKDHKTLLDAAVLVRERLPQLRWIVVGEGPLREKLEERLRALALEQHVSLLGAVPDPERLLPEVTMLVLSSTAEGLGSSVLAAWARGVPVVGTRVGGLGELLASGAGLSVEPRDAPALADAVVRLATDHHLHAELVRRGRVEVERYDVRGMAERVLAVYRSCAYCLDGS
jgi:glycosyltransferase involved in cell wall biosynthesis